MAGTAETAGAEAVWALGFMSGTSMDGVDAALIRTDGEAIVAFGPTAYRAYDAATRAAVADAAARAAAADASGGDARAEDFGEAARHVADRHAEIAEALLVDAAASDAPAAADPAVLGFHGQTVLHRPDKGLTLQIGDADRLAARLGRAVAYDFRSADVAAGGQGAPLAPFYHFALAKRLGGADRVAFVNLGGVANVTFVDPSAAVPEAPGALLACDVGPGGALIDDWMRRRVGAAYDADGAAAAAGTVDAARLARWLARAAPFLSKPAPKSLDRDDFAFALADMDGMSTEDGAATLTALSAACLARAADLAPGAPAQWLLCGGGRRNPTLVAALRTALQVARQAATGSAQGQAAQLRVDPVEAAGLDGDMIEAQAFAYLAVRARRGLPLTAPGATGAPTALSGGRLAAPQTRAA